LWCRAPDAKLTRREVARVDESGETRPTAVPVRDDGPPDSLSPVL
jgi:hypothetical protein